MMSGLTGDFFEQFLKHFVIKLSSYPSSGNVDWKINNSLYCSIVTNDLRCDEQIYITLFRATSALIILVFSRSHVIPAQGLVVLFGRPEVVGRAEGL